jgi:UDP-N-acetylmuramoylalanine--D-glutamate ligase
MADWQGKHVIIIGAARQGTALARYLAGKGASVTLTDMRDAETLAEARMRLADVRGLNWALGEHPASLLDGVDLVCPSGGVPLTVDFIQQAVARGIPLSNDSQVFLDAAPCAVIGITGSAGKTTTTTLVGRMAAAAAQRGLFRQSWVGGNIGTPLIASVDDMQPDDIAVVELSSFQLDLMTTSPKVAAVLNITPNHLDRHGTLEAYAAAKRNIFAHQSAEDALILGLSSPGARALQVHAPGRVLGFQADALPAGIEGAFIKDDQVMLRDARGERPLFDTGLIELRGAHNVLNVLAACAIAAAAGFPDHAIAAGVRGFRGVPHRLEFVRELDGAAWYNDSKATTPGAAIAAMAAFEEPLVLLLGGRDKLLPWDELAALARARARRVIVFGEAAGIIEAALKKALMTQYAVVPGLQTAVQAAREAAQPGDVVLLAPGCTSFDEFDDFEDRGESYKAWVQAL